MNKELLTEGDLADLAKKFRTGAGKTRAQAARDMGIKHPSIFHAEQSPNLPFLKLRKRMIDEYSPYQIEGPFFRLVKKTGPPPA